MSRQPQRKSADKKPAGESLSAIAAQTDLPIVEPLIADLPIADKNARGSVDDMQGMALQAYARKVGIIERDIQNLSEGRLRQNIRAAIYAAMED